MLFHGTIITAASGKLGDSVFSRNRGGPYIRTIGNPNPNPPTDEQNVCRDAMTQMADRWKNTLTVPQRAAWAEYALTAPLLNRIGVRRIVTGRAQFFRSNLVRFQSAYTPGLDIGFIDDAPPPGTPDLPMPAYACTGVVGDQWFSFTFDESAEWNQEGGVLYGWTSPQLNLNINWYRSPMTMQYGILGGGFNPGQLGTDEVLAENQRVFVAMRAQSPLGVVSDTFWTSFVTEVS